MTIHIRPLTVDDIDSAIQYLQEAATTQGALTPNQVGPRLSKKSSAISLRNLLTHGINDEHARVHIAVDNGSLSPSGSTSIHGVSMWLLATPPSDQNNSSLTVNRARRLSRRFSVALGSIVHRDEERRLHVWKRWAKTGCCVNCFLVVKKGEAVEASLGLMDEGSSLVAKDKGHTMYVDADDEKTWERLGFKVKSDEELEGKRWCCMVKEPISVKKPVESEPEEVPEIKVAEDSEPKDIPAVPETVPEIVPETIPEDEPLAAIPATSSATVETELGAAQSTTSEAVSLPTPSIQINIIANVEAPCSTTDAIQEASEQAMNETTSTPLETSNASKHDEPDHHDEIQDATTNSDEVNVESLIKVEDNSLPIAEVPEKKEDRPEPEAHTELEVPIESLVESSVEAPVEAPIEAPIEAPVEAPVKPDEPIIPPKPEPLTPIPVREDPEPVNYKEFRQNEDEPKPKPALDPHLPTKKELKQQKEEAKKLLKLAKLLEKAEKKRMKEEEKARKKESKLNAKTRGRSQSHSEKSRSKKDLGRSKSRRHSIFLPNRKGSLSCSDVAAEEWKEHLTATASTSSRKHSVQERIPPTVPESKELQVEKPKLSTHVTPSSTDKKLNKEHNFRKTFLGKDIGIRIDVPPPPSRDSESSRSVQKIKQWQMGMLAPTSDPQAALRKDISIGECSPTSSTTSFSPLSPISPMSPFSPTRSFNKEGPIPQPKAEVDYVCW
ncbi:MAG: hypothetical protein M1834_009070 [Cirrosporium novae-zelandiae]|nr:MAG: hypothetical protein M1834_009070 [Cirrosporium novae-zelandiae]